MARRRTDAKDDKVAMIPITQREAKALSRLLFDGRTDTISELTADVATTLLEKLRHAVFEPR